MGRRDRRTVRWQLGLALAGLLALTGLAHAQEATKAPATPKLPEPLTREAVRELVARLSDAEVRQLLIAQLDRAAAPARPPADADMAGMLAGMEGGSQRVRGRAGELVAGAAALSVVLAEARGRFLEGRGAGHLLLVAVLLAAMLGAGVLVERLLRWVTGAARRAADDIAGDGLGAATGRLVFRLALDLLALVAFAAGALAFFFAVYQGHAPTRRLVLTYLAAVVLVRLVALLSRLLLAPAAPARRLLPFGDTAARRLHAGVVQLAALYAFGTGTIELLRGLGAPDPTVDALTLVLATAFLVLALQTIWQIRTDVARLILGPGEPGPGRRLAAQAWPVLASAYLVIVYLARALEVLGGAEGMSRAPILSVLLLLALPLVDMVLGRVLAALLGGRAGAAAAGALGARSTFEPVLRRAIHIVVTVGGLVLLADLWHLDLFALAERGLGGRIAGGLLGIAIPLLLAWMLWELARTAIERRMQVEAGSAAEHGAEPGEEGGAPASRMRTLLPLFRMLLLSAIVVMTVLSVLSALGVNILPLLAGAGVFGLAIGFGSQTLVRDVVSGVFFLMDDAFRLGEYIEAGDCKGTVERITIRSLHVRHHRGALNIVPYGEIKRLRNTSRDWMIMALEFRLPYDTDLIKVKKIIKRIGEEIAADPELGPDLLQPLKFQGVMATDDAGLVVRAKFMSKPTSAPYLIRREAYNRILKAFAAEGIRFGSRQVMVVVPPGAPPAAVTGGAAAVTDGGA